jgi:signal transduction histidine kinase
MIRNHQQLESEVRAREKALAAERDAEARERLIEQRLDIARDVHDIVAHSLAGIGVQARLADELVDTDVIQARRSIRAIISTTSEAIRQLRQTVGGLRDAPPAPPSLVDLVEGVAGVDVRLVEDGDTPDSAEVRSTVLAIVREALTNVVRHSGATEAVVTVTRRPTVVTVEVMDNGRGGDPVEGNGIRGMRERVSSVGGTLEAGPAGAGGFAVTAELPT